MIKGQNNHEKKLWYAIYVRSRHEKNVHSALLNKGIESSLPLKTVIRKWSDRKKKVQLPMFRGYVFGKINLNIDGKGKYKIDTGIGFLNHMLEQLSKHSSIDLNVKTKGDTHIDLHHTTEDTGIAIGECLKKASKKFIGIKRYAHAMIPMDETLTRVAIDVSNRPYLIWNVKLKVEKLGEMDTELFKEWFQAFSQSAGITLHVENIYGDNSHHIIESCFKGLARSLRQALEIDPKNKKVIPSTKGSL